MSMQALSVSVVQQLASESGLNIMQSLTLPVRKSISGPIPNRLHESVLNRLSADYPSGLYRHQSLAIESLLDGEDVALSTPTASGKSLVFITAAMDLLAKQPEAKVLAVYPAKALIRDQITKWESALRGSPSRVALIDGTVPTDRRGEILESSGVVLMTPDVLHAWLMSSLKEKRITRFRNALRLLILDEAHVYEGVFGTNMAYLMRRLDVVTGGFQVLCSTATLGRPSDFIFQLTGRRVISIGPEVDGSPAPERHILVSPDPGYDHIVELLRRLAAVDDGRFLAFSDSRRMVEQIVAATMRNKVERNDNEAEDEPDIVSDIDEPSNQQRILPFRAGYEAEDARQIQTALYRGQLGGVVSTSAMELGLDIGEIDLVVMLGLPPSLKAFQQRLGRAGRKRDGICLVIDTKGAIIGSDNGLQAYLSKPLEPSWLYLENRYLQYSNVLCAAAECTELDLTSDQPQFSTLPVSFNRLLENELNPTETVPPDLYPLKQRAQAGPHREFPLRSGIEKEFKITTPQGDNLGTVSFSQMLREAYPGAVYYYMARPYRIVRMDMRDGRLSAVKSKFWNTKPLANTMVFPQFGGGLISLSGNSKGFVVQSELQVSEKVSGFQEMRGRTRLDPHRYGPSSEWYKRDLNRFFETSGVCWYSEDRAGLSEDVGIQIMHTFCLDYGVQERDIGIGLFHSRQDPFGNVQKCQGICIYDAVDGSLRLTQRLAENFVAVIRSAAKYADAEAMISLASELETFAQMCERMPPVAIVQGQRVDSISSPENWTEVIRAGEKGMYVSEDGPREVTIIGYRFTPRGLMYELKPETEDGEGRWMVVDRAIQPLNGVTRTIWVDLMTGEEQEQQPEVVAL